MFAEISFIELLVFEGGGEVSGEEIEWWWNEGFGESSAILPWLPAVSLK
jgi:hypothetical protein